MHSIYVYTDIYQGLKLLQTAVYLFIYIYIIYIYIYINVNIDIDIDR